MTFFSLHYITITKNTILFILQILKRLFINYYIFFYYIIKTQSRYNIFNQNLLYFSSKTVNFQKYQLSF